MSKYWITLRGMREHMVTAAEYNRMVRLLMWDKVTEEDLRSNKYLDIVTEGSISLNAINEELGLARAVNASVFCYGQGESLQEDLRQFVEHITAEYQGKQYGRGTGGDLINQYMERIRNPAPFQALYQEILYLLPYLSEKERESARALFSEMCKGTAPWQDSKESFSGYGMTELQLLHLRVTNELLARRRTAVLQALAKGTLELDLRARNKREELEVAFPARTASERERLEELLEFFENRLDS